MKKRRSSTITFKGAAANALFAQIAVAHGGERARDGMSPGSPIDVATQKELAKKAMHEGMLRAHVREVSSNLIKEKFAGIAASQRLPQEDKAVLEDEVAVVLGFLDKGSSRS